MPVDNFINQEKLEIWGKIKQEYADAEQLYSHTGYNSHVTLSSFNFKTEVSPKKGDVSGL